MNNIFIYLPIEYTGIEKVTNKNLKSDVMGATVIANYGDPGLDENYFADILSRYVICVLDSPLRTLHYNTWSKDMIIIVKRPETLWIDYEGAFSEDISVNRKIDYLTITHQETTSRQEALLTGVYYVSMIFTCVVGFLFFKYSSKRTTL